MDTQSSAISATLKVVFPKRGNFDDIDHEIS